MPWFSRKRPRGFKAAFLTLLSFLLAFGGLFAAPLPAAAAAGTVIAVSQAGYDGSAYKVAYVITDHDLTDKSFRVLNNSATVASGVLDDQGMAWGKRVYVADFSHVTQTGSQFTISSNGAASYPFAIQSNLWSQYKDEMTAFYRLLRSGVATSDVYPQGYSDTAPSAKIFHGASHLDDGVLDGQHYDLVGGWYDAGDYGKYAGNQWVIGELALAYLNHADVADIQYDNDANGIPDLLDEAAFGSEYVIQFADHFGGLMYDINKGYGFQHPDKVSDNIPGTADDRPLLRPNIHGAGKAAGALAAAARAFQYALDHGKIAAGQEGYALDFIDRSEAAALVFYEFAVDNADDFAGPNESYNTRNYGGMDNVLLWAETQLYRLTGNAGYLTSAQGRALALSPGQYYTTNYWDLRPMSLAELYPVAESAVQAHIEQLLRYQAHYFMSLADDTPYGMLNQFGDFGVNEPHASYLGDLMRYYELFEDPAVLQAIQKGLYWIFGGNPWNISWVSGIGADHVDFLHTRLDEQSYDRDSTGVIIPGAMVSGPVLKDTKDRASVSPWYEDRALWADDTNQWRYNEFSISIQAGLVYTIMGMVKHGGDAYQGGTAPQPLKVLSPLTEQTVTGQVDIKVQAAGRVDLAEFRVGGGAWQPLTLSGGVYSAVYDTSGLSPYTTRRVDVRAMDDAGNRSFANTHFTVAPPLPDPSNGLLYDDFGGGGYYGGTSGAAWVNWWNDRGGTGYYERTTIDGRTVGLFRQNPASTASQAKFEPMKDEVDLTGYRYLKVVMKSPTAPQTTVKVAISDGVSSVNISGSTPVAVGGEWDTYLFDMDQYPQLDRSKAHLTFWLLQTAVQPGELYVNEISAVNLPAGTSPVLAQESVTPSRGSNETGFTFHVVYSDADNQPPLAVEAVVDGVVHAMTPADPANTNYQSGAAYAVTTRLPQGLHSYYFRTSDGSSDALSTPLRMGPVIESALNGYWVLDEASGQLALDASLNGRDGLLEGSPQRTDGRIGGALQFDGVQDAVRTSWKELAGNEARSAAVWFKTSASGQGMMLGYGADGANRAFQLGIEGGKLGYFGNGNELTVASAGYTDDAWHHLAVTFDGSNMILYVDGVNVKSKATALDTASDELFLGRGASGGYYQGMLDQAMLYNRKLTAQEIRLLANPDPLVHWTLDEGTGSSVADSSGNDRTGSLTGNPSWTEGPSGFNGALAFDGVDDAVETSWDLLKVNSARTISLWFNTTSISPSTLLGWGTAAGSGFSQISIYGNGEIGFNSGGNNLGTAANGYADGRWHHLALTFDGVTMRLYLDGTLKAARTTTLNTGSSALYLGRAISGSGWFKGKLDDVRIYAGAMTELDIQAQSLSGNN
ncbi:LamG-like jellyroll fold domain-containing protein [Paenibacillus sp. YN15]|uniref:LamG-like jellyroll fold domain-containing protein n=1 Tax=Paenibacillus sp. YN15 TaxID=1742774 RepID=UPI000DCD3902|nr:LamG-like jellyroll fold domain-containing protein [Paenibacillus sp. YN15]RAU98903.1 hypothetical protein DQG13_16760 [Paenibacillus sp. YN15]